MNPIPENVPGRTARRIEDCWNKIGVWGNQECQELERVVHCRNCAVYSSAAARLLDEDLPAKYSEGWTKYFSEEKKADDSNSQSALIFRAGTEWLALAPGIFQEVIDRRPIHSIPHRRDSLVLGLVNVRGELIICVSLEDILGLEKTEVVPEARKVTVYERLFVANREGTRFAFPVAEVHGIHRFQPTELKPIPSTLAKGKGAYTRGLLPWQGKSVGWLDDQLLFYAINRGLA